MMQIRKKHEHITHQNPVSVDSNWDLCSSFSLVDFIQCLLYNDSKNCSLQ